MFTYKCSCCVGLLAFKLLGGRFWAVSPSSYTHIGSFAKYRGSIPATERYATSSQRAIIEKLGSKFGCHTCGTHMRFSPQSFRFVSDHMPPKAVAEQINNRWYNRLLQTKLKYRFYPQCITCSTKQGQILSKATQELKKHHFTNRMVPNLSQAGGGTNAHMHGLRFRINHLTGGILASMSLVGISDTSYDNKP